MPVTIRPRRPLFDRLAASETRDTIRVTIPSDGETVVITGPRGFVVDENRARRPVLILATGLRLCAIDAPVSERRRVVAAIYALAALDGETLAEAAPALLRNVAPVPGSSQPYAARFSPIVALLAGGRGTEATRERIGDDVRVKSAAAERDARTGTEALQALAAARRPVMPAAALARCGGPFLSGGRA